MKYDKTLLSDHSAPVTPSKDWAHSFLRHMGFTKRRGSSTSKLTVDAFDEGNMFSHQSGRYSRPTGFELGSDNHEDFSFSELDHGETSD